ncbi:MAG: squalene synthase HpnC [Calditrichia bacterium]
MKTDHAYQYCLKITRNHYENFPVASILIPGKYRRHIAALYAFARIADDFADEERDRQKLENWRQQLYDSVRKENEHPVFIALADTIGKFDLPLEWLDKLLTAFMWDLEKKRYQNIEELFTYCRHSANPVGRILLWMFGYRSEEVFHYSDNITTALQLTNFWQDMSIDLEKDRIYIPQNLYAQLGISEENILNREYARNWGFLINALVKETQNLFIRGLNLLSIIKGRFRWELKLTILGGLTILRKVKQAQKVILHQRPVLGKRDWMEILFRSSYSKLNKTAVIRYV